MNLDDLTVIVPTRNEAQNVHGFLGSLAREVQLIVVDSSDDNTCEVIEAHRPDHTLILRHPVNVTHARQIGAEAAQTQWLLFTDSDVVFSPGYFERIGAYTGPLTYGPKLSIDEYTSYYRWMSRMMDWSNRIGIPAASGSNLIIRRDAFIASGGFDLRLSCNEDSEIAWRVKRHGYQSVFAPDLIVYASDHRRLRQGVARKTFHSLIRCSLLFSNLMPERWRMSDWGYWKATRSSLLPHGQPGWDKR